MNLFLSPKFYLILSLLLFGTNPLWSKRDTTFFIQNGKSGVQFQIRYPVKTSKATLLLLHGWNLPPNEWCEKTSLCKLALENNYTLIIPNFRKTTYHYQCYPQTIEKYKSYPTRRWIIDTAFVALQTKFGLLKPGHNNFVAGLSTGGRGAALLALELPKIFRGAACLSADFDHSKIPDEPINNAYYGSIKYFPERWTGKDNIQNRVKELKVPLYLAHGKKDFICPVSQTQNFYSAVKKHHPSLQCELFIDETALHNYAFWEKCSKNIIRFFNSLCK